MTLSCCSVPVVVASSIALLLALAHHQRGPVARWFVVGAIGASSLDRTRWRGRGVRVTGDAHQNGTPNFRFAMCIRRRGTLAKVPRASSLKID
jgi:hypothetical protein